MYTILCLNLQVKGQYFPYEGLEANFPYTVFLLLKTL